MTDGPPPAAPVLSPASSAAARLIFRWCSITSLGILGICDGCQANTSTLAQSEMTRVSSYLMSRSPMMRVV
jgi:hypothetical protein